MRQDMASTHLIAQLQNFIRFEAIERMKDDDHWRKEIQLTKKKYLY